MPIVGVPHRDAQGNSGRTTGAADKGKPGKV
jgi:hypothetical protein